MEVRFELSGGVRLRDGSYDLFLHHQPMVQPQETTVALTFAGARIDAVESRSPMDGVGAENATTRVMLVEDQAISIELTRVS